MSEHTSGRDRCGGPDGDREDHPFALNRKRAAVTVVLAVACVAGVGALIGQVADYHKVTGAIASARPGWFVLCFAGEVAAYAGYILAYRDLSRVQDGPSFDLWTVTRVVVLGFGAFVLGSSAGGLAVDFWALQKATGKRQQAIIRTLGLNTLEWAVLGVFAFISAAAVLAGRGAGAPLPMTLSWLILIPVCFGLGLWLTQPGRVERLVRARGPVAARVHGLRGAVRWLEGEARVGFADALGGIVVIRAMFRHPHRYPAGIGGFVVYWVGDLLALYGALGAFGLRLEPTSLVLAYTTGYVITALPLPVGGAGATEATLAWTLHLVGTPFAPALLAAVVYRAFSFWLPILPAVAFLPLARGLTDELERLHSEHEKVSPRPRPQAAGEPS